MFFSGGTLSRQAMCVSVFSIPVSGSTIYLMSSNVFDVGVEVMSELLHCHAESFLFSMTDISADKLSVLRKVRVHSKGCRGFLRVVKTSPYLPTLLAFMAQVFGLVFAFVLLLRVLVLSPGRNPNGKNFPEYPSA